MLIKEYFTDGLLQVAIVLSLLRTDINSYLNTAYYSRTRQTELQEILLGPLAGYTQTDFHTQNYWNDVYGGYAHPKGIRHYDIDLIFRDLHSLSRYRRFDGVDTNINTWLVGSLESGAGDDATRNGAAHAVNNPNEPVADAVLTTPASNEELGANDFFGSELTKEDMDLIDVLWSQDMDLGVSRDMYDVNLRAALEHDSDAQLKKQQQQTLNASTEDKADGRVEDSLTLGGDYIIDGETGELVAVVPTEPATARDQLLQVSPLARQTSMEERWQDVVSLLMDNTSQTHHARDFGMENITAAGGYGIDNAVGDYGIDNAVGDYGIDNAAGGYGIDSGTAAMEYEMVGLENRVEAMDYGMAGIAGGSYGGVMEGLREGDQSILLQNVSMGNSIDNITLQNMSFVSALNMASPIDFTNNETMAWSLSPILSPDVLGLNISADTSPSYNMTSNNMTSFLNQLVASAGSAMPRPDQDNITTNLSTYLNAESVLEELLNSHYNELTFDDLVTDVPYGTAFQTTHDDWSSDSAVSSLASSWQQDSDYTTGYDRQTEHAAVDGAAAYDGLDGAATYNAVEGATGGSDDVTTPSKCDDSSYDQVYGESYASRSRSSSSNSSWPSNSSSYQPLDISKKHVVHNHTYPLQPGQRSRDEEKAELKREKQDRAMRCRDEKKAKALKLPISIDDIVSTPVDDFTELLTKYRLNDAQHQLIRDIRRRGKNKQAAQNCRKRKLEVIQTLEDEVESLRRSRDRLTTERRNMERESLQFKQKYGDLERQLFESLRDPLGQRYNRDDFSLVQSSDGNFFIVPRDPRQTASQETHPDKQARKRKPKRKD